MKPPMNIIVEDIDENNDYEVNNVVDRVEFNNMNEDGNGMESTTVKRIKMRLRVRLLFKEMFNIKFLKICLLNRL